MTKSPSDHFHKTVTHIFPSLLFYNSKLRCTKSSVPLTTVSLCQRSYFRASSTSVRRELSSGSNLECGRRRRVDCSSSASESSPCTNGLVIFLTGRKAASRKTVELENRTGLRQSVYWHIQNL